MTAICFGCFTAVGLINTSFYLSFLLHVFFLLQNIDSLACFLIFAIESFSEDKNILFASHGSYFRYTKVYGG